MWNATFTSYRFYMKNTGRCGLGNKCKYSHLQLRDCHICEKFKIVLHDFCAVRNGEYDHILYSRLWDDNLPIAEENWTISTRRTQRKSINVVDEAITSGKKVITNYKSFDEKKRNEYGSTSKWFWSDSWREWRLWC